MGSIAEIGSQPGVLLLLAFLLGWLLARFLPDVLAFALAGWGLSYFLPRLWPAADPRWLTAGLWPLMLAAYLIGNAFPWRRLEIIRGRMCRLWGSVALSYALLLGLLVLFVWQFGLLARLKPWLLCFTLMFGLISCQEPWRRVRQLSARGPLSLVLPHLGALSAFVVLLGADIVCNSPLAVLRSALAAPVFFALWLGFIRLAGLSPSSLPARVLQLGFLLGVSYFPEFSPLTACLLLGLANALTGSKVVDAGLKLELWRILNAGVFLLIFGWLEFSFNALAAAAFMLALRFILFYLYNLFSRLYLFGADFGKRVNLGLQISDGTIILLLRALNFDQLILTAAVLTVIAENLLYPAALKYALVQSGEAE
ncbi:MAG: hypothetical protein LBQ83_06110 [Candidatus Margulisbacteria bacterium]|jgi:hypothetical protein|nr:hypothetical protein [Candidatus Margulisiibacteriota bacterium]